jgi:catechol 2,3-dioxygenase-like lactoylglutathione lyase family enzyme
MGNTTIMSNGLKIDHIDHIVLTTKDVNKVIEFYTKILGFQLYTYGEDQRKALIFGEYKINIHSVDQFYEPKAKQPTPGSIDLCLISKTPLKEIIAYLNEKNIPIESGPRRRTGATKLILSIYVRDPDGNLIEIANEVT